MLIILEYIYDLQQNLALIPLLLRHMLSYKSPKETSQDMNVSSHQHIVLNS